MESNQDFGSLLSITPSGSTPAPSGSGFGDLLSAQPAPAKSYRQPAATGPIDDTAIGAVADQEGLTPTQRRVMTALLGQESGNGRNTATSTDGARGAGQIIPATFSRYAKPGETIDNTDHNLAVMARIVKDLGNKFGDDPAKIATGYFSGEGNVGKDAAWKNDRADGNGKRVSSYVQDVLGRLGSIGESKAAQPAGQLPDLAKIPKWGEIAAGKKFQGLSGDDQLKVKGQYFDEVIAPHAKAAGADVDSERQKFLATDAPPTQAEIDAASKPAFLAPRQRMTPQEKQSGSVLEGQDMTAPDLSTTSRVPVKPEMRQAFNAKWDASSKDERDALAQRPDWVGMLARERAGVFERYDQGKEVPGVGRMPSVADKLDTRTEGRTSRLISEGVDPQFAEAPARMGAAAGVAPGKEMAYLERATGTVGKSDFDFETQAMFDPNQSTNGLNNALTRGLAKAGLGIGKSITGLAQFEAEVLGMDDSVVARTKDAGKWVRNKENAIGERGDLITRNLEGAINSIVQNMPIMIGGVKGAAQATMLAGMAMQTFGQEYSDGRSKGQSVGDATTRAGVFAAFEVIGEKFGLGETLKAYKAAAKGLPADQIAGFLWAALKKEVPGEVLTTTGQFATDKFSPEGVALNPNATGVDYLKQVGDTIIQTLMQSGITAGGTTGVSKAVQFLSAPKMPEDEFARALQSEIDNKQFNREGINEQVVRSMNPDGTLYVPTQRQDYSRPAVQPAEEAGAPAVNPPAAPAATAPTSPAQQVIESIAPDANATNDDDVRAMADSRLEMLRDKLAGDDDSDQPTGSLTPAQQQELTQLEAAGDDVAKLRQIYGLDQPSTEKTNETQQQDQATGPAQRPGAGDENGLSSGPADLGGNQPGTKTSGTEVGAPAGQRHEGLPAEDAVSESEAELEARLEREAMQAEDTPVETQDDGVDPPFFDNEFSQEQTANVPQPQELGTQEGQAAGPQGEAPAAEQPVTPPKTEKEAKAQREQKQPEPEFTRKEIPAMSDEELVAAQQYYSDRGHKRAAKIEKELNKRAQAKQESNGTQAPQAQQATQEGLQGQAQGDQDQERAKLVADLEAAEARYKARDYDPRGGESLAWFAISDARTALEEYDLKKLVPPNVIIKPKTEREAKERKDQVQQPAPTGEAPEAGAGASQPTQAATALDAELQDALAHLGDVLSDVFQPKMNMMPAQYGAGDLLPALSKVVELLVRKGFKKFSEATAQAAQAMRSHEKTAQFVDQISPRQWKAAYNAVAEFHEGTDTEEDVSAISNDDVKALAGAKKVEEKSTAKPPVTEPVATAHDLHTPEGKFKVAQTLADEFIGGASFGSIIEARKRIGELIGGKKIEPGTELAKQADETIEVAVVLAGRAIVEAGRKQGRSPQVIFNRLVSLYNAQPNLAVRSSTSVRDQAYSTPVPLAFVASELAGVTYDTKMVESTAGNGMLAIGAKIGNVTVNELNPKRAAMLEAMGFKPTTQNAATQTIAPAKSQDAVVINPPFGVTKDTNGQTIIYEVSPSYGTSEVDHAIVFKTLEALKDDGRAVLIIGGSNATTEEGRRDDYRGKSKRTFAFNLYGKYNVVDHFTIDGSLYSKQGASYPVDVIVIEGRGKSQRDLPAADLPKIITSYDELKEKLNGTRTLVPEGDVRTDRTDGSQDSTGQGDGEGLGGGTGGSGTGSGGQGSRQPAGGVRSSGGGGTGSGRGSRTGNGAAKPQPADSVQSGDAGTGPVPGDSGRADTGSQGSTESLPDGLGGTSVVNGERVESGLTDRRGEEQETEGQVAYTPHSNAASVGTLVPAAMRDAIEASLQKMEDQFGNLDDYVAERLNMDPETVRSNFSAEQVDALALSIKNAEEGRGFIIGDQTGIGKGRVVAAMIRYALVNDKVPIFVTEKPNLYADMIRDLDDIGMTDELGLDTKKPRILITNSSESIPYSIIREVNGEPAETNLTLKSPKSGDAMNKLMREMMAGESLGEYKVIFTTYSQLQTVKGKVTDRMNFVKQFGAGNYMIFDESHNAGGAGETQARNKEQREKAENGESLVEGRAAYVRQLVTAAYGTFFSSATYAKRPDVMDLYSSTNMKLAVDRLSQLGEAIKHGGVPMQQVVANMLTTDGQYIRRERTFAGVAYDTVETKVDKQTAENMASAMRAVLAFSRAKEKVITAIQKEMDKEGAMVREIGGSKASIEGANFGAIMHNLIDQMLLSLKAQDSVRHAMDRLQAGEKVVLTVSNTMGSFLKDYAEEMGLNMGDPVSLSFADLYQRYLEKQRWVTIKDGGGMKTKRRLADAELGPGLVSMFNAIAEQIRNSGFGSAPISPIDYLHNELRKAGYKTDEITGRTATLSYEGGTPKLTSRSANIKQRVNAVRGFNNGTVDVLILNQAGSTGLSLHASSKFKDQRKRHMIIVQAEKNIDTHMQMLGRVHRTGQIIAPAYSQMMADVPAEMRPAAVLLKKMASLNANTTASRKSSVTADGVVDFMNDYGGQVAQEYLLDNLDVYDGLGLRGRLQFAKDSSDATEDDIRKFTGYIPILPIKQQEEIYLDLIDRYNELLERENSMGTNKLEAKVIDLDAETLSTRTITEDKGDPSIFASPANMEQVNVKRTVKPFTSTEVLDMVDERLGGKSAHEVTAQHLADLKERAAKFAQERIAKMSAEKDADPVKIETQKNQLNLVYANTKTILENYHIGQSIAVSDTMQNIVYGVITDIKPAKRTANPAAGSDWKVSIALANGDAKSLSLTFSQIGSKFNLKQESRVNWYNGETQQAEMMSVLSIFDKGATSRREKRWIVTGNILAGYAKYPGQIITFTRKDGTTGQGVLMSRQFDFEKEQKNQPVRLKTGLEAVKFIQQYQGTVGTQDGILRVNKQGNRYNIVVPASKKDGGSYYLDQQITAITGDFYKRSSTMSASLYYADDVVKVLEYVMQVRQEPIVALTHADKAREMMAEQNGQRFADLRATPSYAFAGMPESNRVNARDKLNKLEKKLEAGKITEAEYVLGVREVTRAMNDQSDERAYKAVMTERRRGADWIVAQLMRGVADNVVPRHQAEFAKWMLDQNPNLANDLGYSITSKQGDNARGDYNPISKVIRLFSSNLDEQGETAVHEILHHTERMMPGEVQDAVLREWQRAWDAAFKKADPKLKAAMQDMLQSAFGDKKAGERVGKAFANGVLDYDKHYQLYSPSEFWAVNATRILSNRYKASGSWIQRAAQWFKEFVQRVKGMLGLRSDAPIIKAMNNLMKGEGAFVSQQMLVNKDYSMWLAEKEVEQQENDAPVRDIVGRVQRNVTQFFGNRQNLRTFSAYDRTLSTQFNKALKDEHYGKVFAFVNAMQNEVSLTSIRPSELAPGILRKVDDFKSAIKTLVAGADKNKSMAGATNALISGTLAGDNVLEGKVWTEEELRNNFRLDDAGVALYQQARAAVDASLDEVAAAEAYAMAQGYVPKQSRRIIIDKPQSTNRVIFGAIRQARKLLETALENARNQQASPERIAYLEESIKGYNDTEERVAAIFAKARDLKNAGYMPLMRFGKFHVGAEQVDEHGKVIRGDDGSPATLSYQMFETMAEAAEAKRQLEMQYAGQDVRVYAGPHSNESHKLYSGISPETLALFAEEVGADKVLKELYKNALSERSALKRRLERKAVAGYSQDLPRILANFVTSNGRFAAQRYYMRDLNNAIKYIPKRTKGDVLDEAIKLREHIMNPNDPAAPVSAAMFAWFLGGSVASAVVNLSQPILMTGPYLTQFGVGTASKALAKALPMALGKKQIADQDLRKALKRASQEGIVEAQEIFHLYSQGAQGVSAQLANALSKIPFAGDRLKAGTEGVRARSEAFFTLWGMMFSAAESFNRKLTFLAAWDVAMQTRNPNPYAFAVRAVNETQGIYNKANRPNWARGPVGRTVLTFKQFSLMYVELVKRMWKAGPEGKRAAMVMLGMLMLAAGEEGLPFSQDLDDLIDTLGQWMDFDTNVKRSKRRLAYDMLGEKLGDLFLYGASSALPLDFSGRLGLGNLIPGSGLAKKSSEGNKLREVTEVVGPTGSLIQQINDAYEAASEGNLRKAFENVAPKAAKDLMAGAKMATTGYATDTVGRKNMDVTLADAAIKAVGFNPTKLAEASRARAPIMQDRALQKATESSIVDTWARGVALQDEGLMADAQQKLERWNEKNPDNPVQINSDQIRQKARQYLMDQNTRIIKSTPRELRGRAGLDLAR